MNTRVEEIRADIKGANRPCACPPHTAVRDLLAVIDRVEALANYHSDWCCSKGCRGHGLLVRTGPGENDFAGDVERCTGECNCEARELREALDGPP